MDYGARQRCEKSSAAGNTAIASAAPPHSLSPDTPRRCADLANEPADRIPRPRRPRRLALTLLGDPPPIRDAGLLGSAAALPQPTGFGEDANPALITKAGALLQSIVNDHALVDGNKRLGWHATAVFSELNGIKASRVSNDDVYDLVIWIAASKPRRR